jgi:hypothetical protein
MFLAETYFGGRGGYDIGGALLQSLRCMEIAKRADRTARVVVYFLPIDGVHVHAIELLNVRNIRQSNRQIGPDPHLFLNIYAVSVIAGHSCHIDDHVRLPLGVQIKVNM